MSKIKFGVLGVSKHFITRMMIPFKSSEEAELIGIASRNIEKAESAAKDWDIKKIYPTYEALIEDEEIQAIYIPLPNHMHLQWIKKAVEAGKHVLCEKPITLNESELDELVSFMSDRDEKVMEAFMYRFHPKWKEVVELLKVSGIGKVQSVHSVFTYDNSDPKNIRNIKEYGGGAMMDIGCYALNSMRLIMNREPLSIVSKVNYSDDFGTDILSSALVDFGDAHGMFTVSTSTYPVQEVRIYGTGGYMVVPMPFNEFYDSKSYLKVVTGLGERTIEFQATNQYNCMITEFCQSIIENKPIALSLENSKYNMRLIDLVLKSAETKKWEQI